MSETGTWDPNQTPDPPASVSDVISALFDPTVLTTLAEAMGGGQYPGVGSGGNDTMPMVDSVAPGFPLNLPFLVAGNQVKLQSVKLSFQPQAFRTYYSATPHSHGGDVIQTLGITINNEAQTHKHQVSLFQGNVGSDGGGQWQKHIVEGKNHASIGDGHEMNAWLHTDNGMAEDIWTGPDGAVSQADFSPGGDHSHTNVAHTHTPGTTGNNNPTTGVQEGTSPDAMHVMVDGTDVTNQLGGPFSTAQTELDITPYVSPSKGLHQVQVTSSTQLGRIAGFVRHKFIQNNLSPLA